MLDGCVKEMHFCAFTKPLCGCLWSEITLDLRKHLETGELE